MSQPPEKKGEEANARSMSQRRSMELPEELRGGDDVPNEGTGLQDADSGNMMNQSIFSMIARAGSHQDPSLQTLFEGRSSDSEGSRSDNDDAPHPGAIRSVYTSERLKGQEGGQRKDLTERKLFKSPPRLHARPRHRKMSDQNMSSSQILAAQPAHPGRPSLEESLSEISQHQNDPSFDALIPTNPSNLANRLKQIFQFEEVEDVISAYTCWLVQNVLLQGFMYITKNHVCFFAYLPKVYKDVSRKGYLAKRGNSKYTRYWFSLTGNTLSYYADPQDIYFPRNRISLQYGISASVDEVKEKGKEAAGFTVVTDQKTYYFKADSATSAADWVNAIQKVIFRTHNEGNSVKISMPLRNIVEVDESPLSNFKETIKIRVIDNDETYAVDEYFFSFASHGHDFLNIVRIMVDGTDKAELPMLKNKGVVANTPGDDGQASTPEVTPAITEHVKATLLPLHLRGQRTSGEMARISSDSQRRSLDGGRRYRRSSHDQKIVTTSPGHQRESFGTSNNLHYSDFSGHPMESTTESIISNSLGPGTESSAAIMSLDETDVSGSQILQRSDVFQGPTIHHSDLSVSYSSVDQGRRVSQDTTKSLDKLDGNASNQHHDFKKRSKTQIPTKDHTTLQDLDGPDDPKPSKPSSSTTLQGLMQPIQKATGVVGLLRNRSKRMGSLLATETMGYYEKVSGMWAGGHKHYNLSNELNAEDHIGDVEDEEAAKIDAERFRMHFALPESEKLEAVFFGSLQRVIPVYGKLYLSNRHLCFRSFLPTTRTRLVLPLKDIENVEKEKGFRMHYHGLVLVIRGHEELFFEFNRKVVRDACAVSLHRSLESARYMADDDSVAQEEIGDETAKAEDEMLREARRGEHITSQKNSISDLSKAPLIFDDSGADILELKPKESLRVTCLTIGSRGDVQPYIALCKGLIKEGHKPRIATHAEFEPWVRSHGIDFSPVAGNPAELMRICVEHGMFTYGFLKETTSKFRVWLDELLRSAYGACEGSDLLIESPSAMAGIHIAEALEIPYFRAFTMPWTRTRTYPHAFTVPEHKLGGAYNSVTYVAFENIFWQAIAGQVNTWRRSELGLRNTNLRLLQSHLRPFMYNFSPSVVAPPIDWPDWISITGYWFLDEATTWEPSKDLLDFIKQAREDGKKLVYVGFGSIVVDKPQEMTAIVVEAVEKAGIRCILSRGWSDRLGKKEKTEAVPLPSCIFEIQSAPHDWLFKQIDAAVHHGGSGTTGASLRAGIPTVIRPFFGDQFFYGSRVEDLGVGICIRHWSAKSVGRALWEATHDERIRSKAKSLGEQIRKETGVQTAIQTVYRELDRARSLINKRSLTDKESATDPEEEIDESWTWIEGEEEEFSANLPGHFGNPLAHLEQLPPPDRGADAATVFSSMILKGATHDQLKASTKGKERARE